jgi:dTDP-4-dehydrorhamnose reductase
VKVLVIGATGMLGHKMLQVVSRRFPDTWGTIRGRRQDAGNARWEFLQNERIVEGVDVLNIDALEGVIRTHRFDAVINCIGVIKQRDDSKVSIPSITINSLMPHRLAATVAEWGGRVVHFSTDCVFSGRRGNYSEDDESDAVDLYGKSKYLGEVATNNALTLRTSIIGRELHHHHSLLDWFLSQRGRSIYGFQRHYWSGVTTNHLAELVTDILGRHPDLHGLYQVSSGRIDKHSLLQRFKTAFDYDIHILPSDEHFLDRSLTGDKLRERIGYVPPTWDQMLAGLVNDPTEYPRLDRTGA